MSAEERTIAVARHYAEVVAACRQERIGGAWLNRPETGPWRHGHYAAFTVCVEE